MRIIISLSVMCLLLWVAFQEKDLTPPLLGKTKISYASYQNASILHVPPQKVVTMSRLTVSAIKEYAQTSSLTDQPTSQPTSQSTRSPQGAVGAKLNQITGKLYLDRELRSKFKSSSTLFIIVRGDAPAGQRGPLIASTKRDRLNLSDFPLSYVVTQANSMMGAPLSGKVRVSARLDQDGDALSKEPGDIVGSADEGVEVGVNPVNIKLNSTL